jgi:peptide-methionine (S)-S-oxide reductase
MKIKISYFAIGCVLTLGSCSEQNPKAMANSNSQTSNTIEMAQPNQTDTATLGAGCFWCVEAVFQNLNGVMSVTSGYSGGTVKNPSYKEVCTGQTGHAEVCNIVYDPSKISFDEILEVFWKTHDPTTMNQQGNDVGTQYRSAIFYHTQEQKELAEKYKKELNASGAFDHPIVTEIAPYTNFYKAEDYHQNYFNENGDQPYCRFVIQPKVEKFKKVFKDKLKPTN